MTSNFETIYNKLLNYKLDENIIYMQANYLKTFYLMRDGKYIQETPAILFLGQTQYDKSLINNETGEIYISIYGIPNSSKILRIQLSIS